MTRPEFNKKVWRNDDHSPDECGCTWKMESKDEEWVVFFNPGHTKQYVAMKPKVGYAYAAVKSIDNWDDVISEYKKSLEEQIDIFKNEIDKLYK